MPDPHTILGFLIVVLVIWVILKVAKVAIRLIVLFIGLIIALGVVYYLFMR